VNETHTSPHPGIVPEKQPPTIQARTRRRRRITRAGLAVGISVATLILSRSSEQRAHGSDQQPQQTQATNATSIEPPIEAAPALNPPKAPSSRRNRTAGRISKTPKSTPVNTRKPLSRPPEKSVRFEKVTAPDDGALSRTFVESDVTSVADAVTSALTVGSASPSVTITGCLEMSVDGSEFRLADTEGDDAPKSRSWRTGFLTTRRAPVALIDPPESFGLRSSVGKRVAATGSLTSRNLTVSALRVVDPLCN
jgi:hypothetical protein